LSRAEFETRLGELKANLNVFNQGQTVIVAFDTVRTHLPALLDLIRDMLKTPALSPSEFDLLIKENLAQLEAQRSEPRAIVAEASARAKNVLYKKGDLRYIDSLDEGIAEYRAVKLDSVRAFHQHYFGLNHGEIALVGDFDAAAIKTQLNSAFGQWNSQKAYNRLPTLALTTVGSEFSAETPDKANAAYVAELPLTMTDQSPDFAAMLIVNKVLGGGTKSRLLERLRQKDGISYGAGSRLNVAALDQAASLTLQAIYAPQNLAKLKQGIREELTRLLADGISAEELQDAKQALLQENHVRRAQDAALAATLRQQLFLGRSMQFDAALDAKITQLKLDEVNQAMRQYVKPEQFTHYYAGDFAGAAKKAAAVKAE
jgi:zinc protease